MNDKSAAFYEMMRDFSAQARRTPSGSPVQNHVGNRFRTFHQVMDELIDSFDAHKSTRFEGRIRAGSKGVWMESAEARAHFLYRTVCKLILLVAAAPNCNQRPRSK